MKVSTPENKSFLLTTPMSDILIESTSLIFFSTGNSSNSSSLFSSLLGHISYVMIFIAFFGMLGNVLIIITFSKIGFTETINISYCALGLSDLLCVALFTYNAVCFLPAFANSNIPFLAREVVVPTGGATSDMFCEITAWITAFISVERCLCVVFPLKIKTIVSRRRTILTIVAIFFMAICPIMSITFYIYIFVKKFDARRNATVIGIRFRESSLADFLDDLNFMYKLVIMNIVPLVMVFVSSFTLAVHLNKIASWRLGNSDAASKNTNMNRIVVVRGGGGGEGGGGLVEVVVVVV
ncbi:chemosensory receptor A [Elysia marginata]|uniref:Chemosensory receptor A n=1 Tax=Elysia marginata TaxID=1093978 RepID=A0AAV4EG54_9GAST|nr:chemosensory receptor A [Elysia marginata]